MATLIDEKGLQHYADKMVKAENRKVGTKSLPTALTEIDAMIDSMKGKFEQAYGDAIEETFENTENTFKIGTGIDEDRSETVEDGFISIDKLEGKTLVNRLKGENKTVQLPHRIELDEMIIKPNTDYTFQSSNGSAIASFKQPKYQEVVCQEGIKLENNLDVSNKIEFRSVEGQTLKNYIDCDSAKSFGNWDGHNCAGYLTLNSNLKANTQYTLIADDLPPFVRNMFMRLRGFNDEIQSFTTPVGDGRAKTRIVYCFTTLREVDGRGDLTPHFYVTQSDVTINANHFNEKRAKFMILEGDYTQKDVPDFIEGVQGVGRKSKNLFNSNEFENINNWIGGDSAYKSFPIKGLMPNGKYTFSQIGDPKEKGYAIAIHNVPTVASGTWINHQSHGANKGVVTATSNGELYFNCYPNREEDVKRIGEILKAKHFMLEQGDHATPYEPYYEGYKIGVKTHGKNFVNSKELIKGILTNENFNINSSSYPAYVTLKRYLKKGNYVITFSSEVVITREVRDGEMLFRSKTNVKEYKITIKNDSLYGLSFRDNKDNSKPWDYSINLQLEEGTQATSYQPYKESASEIILQDQLQGIGDVKDKLYFDEGYKVERHFKKVVLKGGEDWKPYGQQSEGYFTGVVPAHDAKHLGKVFCDKFENKSIWSSATLSEGVQIETFTTGEYIFIKIKSEKLESNNVEGFKKWLKANNTTVVYELETPTTTDTQIKDQIKLDTYQPTYFTVDSGIAPSKTTIDVPVLEQITGKSGALRTPATLDRVYLDIQGSGSAERLMLFEGNNNFSNSYFTGFKSSCQSGLLSMKSLNRNLVKKVSFGADDSYRTVQKTDELYLGQPVWKETKKTSGTPPTNMGVFDIAPGETYSASIWVKSSINNPGNTPQLSFYSFLDRKYYFSELAEKKSDWTRIEMSYTNKTNKTIREMNLLFYGASKEGQITYFACPQLEKAKSPTAYEFQREIDSITLNLPHPLRSVGEIKDRIVKINGEYYLEQNIEEFKLAEQLPSGYHFAEPDRFAIYQFEDARHGRDYCIADKLPTTGGYSNPDYDYDFSGWRDEKSAEFVGRLKGCNSLAEQKEWFKKNPTTVLYVLKTPVLTKLKSITLEACKSGHVQIESSVNVASTHTVALNKPGQILKNIEELTILRDRVEKLEANYDQIALEQAHQLALTKQSIELDYEL